MMLELGVDVLQVIFADLLLSGDNALIIGMAAASLPPQMRQRAIFLGLAVAAALRIIFALAASFLISLPGLLFVGGLLLSWVCWQFYKDLRGFGEQEHAEQIDPDAKMSKALFTIMLADVSMSIDNVLAVAAIARDNTALLIFGLVLAILMMAIFSQAVMRILQRYRWLSYVGLGFLIYLSGVMLFDGVVQLADYFSHR